MSIDMTTVKQIMHNNKEVSKIEDLNGNILWQLAPQKVLQSITLSGYTTTFNVGNTFSYGGTVTALYSDGTTADVTANTTFSGYNMSSAGTQTVTASYTEAGVTQTATYSITVYKVLSSIALSGQTTSLNRGATFSFGGTVTATYNDGSTANVTSSTTFSGYNMSKSGTYTVTASYTYRSVTKTATYTLTVNKVWTQIWSGSKESYARAYYSSWTNYTAGGVIKTINTTSYGTASGVKARVTFSFSASGKGGTSFTPSNKTSPVTFTGIGSAHNSFIRAQGTASNAAYYASAYCNYTVSGTTGTFQLYVGRNSSTAASNQEYYAQVTVTKIELYY